MNKKTIIAYPWRFLQSPFTELDERSSKMSQQEINIDDIVVFSDKTAKSKVLERGDDEFEETLHNAIKYGHDMSIETDYSYGYCVYRTW